MTQNALIQVEVKLLRVPTARLAGLGLSSGTLEMLSAQQAPSRLDDLVNTDGVTVVSSPRLTLFPMQRGQFSTRRRVDFISSYKRYERVLPTDKPLMVPIVENVHEGLTVEVQVIPLGGSPMTFGVDLVVENAVLRDPVNSWTTSDGPIAQPVVNTQRVNSTVRMANGGVVLYPTHHGDDDMVVVMMRMDLVQPLDTGFEDINAKERRRR